MGLGTVSKAQGVYTFLSWRGKPKEQQPGARIHPCLLGLRKELAGKPRVKENPLWNEQKQKEQKPLTQLTPPQGDTDAVGDVYQPCFSKLTAGQPWYSAFPGPTFHCFIITAHGTGLNKWLTRLEDSEVSLAGGQLIRSSCDHHRVAPT